MSLGQWANAGSAETGSSAEIRRLAILQCGIQQLPAGDQVLQNALQTLYVERRRQISNAGNRVFVELLGVPAPAACRQARKPALLGAIIIIVIEVEAGGRVVILLQDALPDHLFD